MLNYVTKLFDHLLFTPSSSGYCFTCERATEWTEQHHYYRCSYCGDDPLHDRPEKA